MGVVGFILTFAILQIPFFKISLGASLFEGLAVAILSMGWMFWRESRKPPVEPPRKRKR